MRIGWRGARPALATALLLGSLAAGTGVGAGSALAEPTGLGAAVTTASAPAQEEGMTPGRVAFLALGGAGVLVLAAALRAPGGRAAHRARRRRVPHDRPGGRAG